MILLCYGYDNDDYDDDEINILMNIDDNDEYTIITTITIISYLIELYFPQYEQSHLRVFHMYLHH